MALETIMAAISTQLATLAGTGPVHLYDPTSVAPANITTQLGQAGTVNFWAVLMTKTAEYPLASLQALRIYTFLLQLYQEVRNAAVSEPQARVLSEAAMDLLRPLIPLSTATVMWPLQRTVFEARTLGGLMLCHYAEHVLYVRETVSVAAPPSPQTRVILTAAGATQHAMWLALGHAVQITYPRSVDLEPLNTENVG